MKKQFLLILLSGILLMNACQKEVSTETGDNPSAGSLKSDVSGDCLPKTVNGTYEAGTALVTTTNTISVDVNVTKTGNFTIYTDTVNGYFFRTTGIFTTTGVSTITLKGIGTPLGAGVNNFIVHYDTSSCTVPVTVLPAGSGGPAVFTLAGSPATCSSTTINGTYTLGTPLTSANTVVLSVNVTTIGTYNITTTATGGMVFAASGTFISTGVQNVTLAASGTPTTAGNNTIPVTAGSSSCSFVIPVGSASAGILGGAGGACTPSTVNGTYTVGTALAAGNTVSVQVNVTTIGNYSITTNTLTGFSFAASGTFTSSGTNTVSLTGTGTPTTAGAQTFTVTYGTSTCTFTVNVAAAPATDYFPRTTSSNWSYEFDDNVTPGDTLIRKVIATSHAALGNSYAIFLGDPGTGYDSSGYYRKSGGDYYEYLDAGALFGYDAASWGEYIMLKDNVAVGTNWKSAGFSGTYTPTGGSPTPLTLRFSYTILQKDVPVSVTTSTGTVNYTNVIVVEEKYEQQIAPGTWQDITSIVGSGKSYYARNIGLIMYQGLDASGVQSFLMELRRKEIY